MPSYRMVVKLPCDLQVRLSPVKGKSPNPGINTSEPNHRSKDVEVGAHPWFPKV